MSINFGDGSSTQQYADVGSSGQTWQTVSRSDNTWYQNTTGRPIQLGIGLLTSRYIYIGSSTSNYVEVIATGGDHSEALNGHFVPVNHYYKTNGYRTWTEFR